MYIHLFFVVKKNMYIKNIYICVCMYFEFNSKMFVHVEPMSSW